MLAANFIWQMVRNRKLQEVAGYSLVTEDRSGIFYRRANVKVFALGVVGWNEIETTIVFIVDTGRIHKAAGACWLEGFGKLANFKPAQVRRHSDQAIGLQKIYHLRQTA